MMPHALEASKATGVDPRIILAQSAIETGWGKSAPGNNYFGIKSHGAAGGNTMATTEVVNGQPVRISDSFRAFPDMAASAAGYGDFINQNPRYAGLKQAQGLDAQAAALQRSGYATDPNYGAKVLSVARRLPDPGTVASAGPDAANLPAPGAQPAGFQIPGEAPASSPASASASSSFGGITSLTPQMKDALNAAWRNPNTRSMAASIFSSMLTGKDSPWKMERVNGQSAWVNNRTREVLPVGERHVEATSEQKNFEQVLKDPRFQAYLDNQRRPLTPTIVSPGQTVLPPGEYGVPSFQAPPKQEGFTLSAGQTRFENGQPVANAPDRDKTNEGEAKLRGEFSKQLGSFNDVQDAYGRIIAAMKGRETNPGAVSPASDIGLVFGFMKMLDPGSVVREGEYATAKNATGVPEQVLNTYNKLLSGEFLGPDQRQDFVDTAGQLYGQARQAAEAHATRYRDLARGQGLDEGRVVALPNALAAPQVAIKAPASSGPDATKPTQSATPPKLGSVKIPMGAVGALRADPTMREQFDAKYGKGASDRILGRAKE